MRRNSRGLVRNEEIVLLTGLRLHQEGTDAFHGYALRELWDAEASKTHKMNYATLYRCLDRLEEMGLLESSYDVITKNGGPPRRMFRLSGAGFSMATEVVEAGVIDPGTLGAS